MKNVMIYIHGKGGSVEEAKYYRKFFNEDFDIIGFDYKSEKPWDAKIEFVNYFDSIIPRYNKTILIANSIGAYFSLISLADKKITKAMLISPIVDMERLILDMMLPANVSEEELSIKKEIETSLEKYCLGNICLMQEEIRYIGIYLLKFFMEKRII